MAKSKHPEKVLADTKAAMGNELGQLFYELDQEVIWLHTHWGAFESLFDPEESKQEVLGKIANSFMAVVHGLFVRRIVLHICQITDPPGTGHKKNAKANLTILRLADLVDDQELKERTENAAKAIVTNATFARVLRNRKFAHLDLATVRGEHKQPLPPVSFSAIKEIMDGLAEMMNDILVHYMSATMMYDHWVRYGDASMLIDCAVRGYEEKKRDLDKFLE